MAYKTGIAAAGIVTTTIDNKTVRRIQVSGLKNGQMVLWAHPGEETEFRMYKLPKVVKEKIEAVKLMLRMKEFTSKDKALFRNILEGKVPLQSRIQREKTNTIHKKVLSKAKKVKARKSSPQKIAA